MLARAMGRWRCACLALLACALALAAAGPLASTAGASTGFSANPTSQAFTEDIDDGVSADQTATFTNNSGGGLSIASVAIGGPNAADFGITGPGAGDCSAGVMLVDGSSCTVAVHFDPSVTGSKTATLTVTTSGPLATVDLTGNATQTSWSRSSGTLDFGSRDVTAAASTEQTSVVQNTGTEQITLTDALLEGTDASQFEHPTDLSTDCKAGTSLNAGATCDVRVRFHPSSTGAKSADVKVSAPGLPDLTVSLLGTGTKTELSRSPATFTFDNREIDAGPSTQELDVTVTNSGTEDVTLTSVDPGDAQFVQQTGSGTDCAAGTLLHAAGTCHVRVKFDPSSVGHKTATLTVHSNAPDVSTALDGTGIHTALSRSQPSLSFGNQDIDDGPTPPMTSVITNSGSCALRSMVGASDPLPNLMLPNTLPPTTGRVVPFIVTNASTQRVPRSPTLTNGIGASQKVFGGDSIVMANEFSEKPPDVREITVSTNDRPNASRPVRPGATAIVSGATSNSSAIAASVRESVR